MNHVDLDQTLFAKNSDRPRVECQPLGTISLRHEFLLARLGDLSARYVLMGEGFLNLPEAIRR